jgi:hypothetical protein
MTPLEILDAACERGLSLNMRGGQLAVSPNRLLTPDFEGTLREFKPVLSPLLASKGRTWIELYSERLGETVFFCEDEAAQVLLVASGASEWSIYTKAELRTLIVQNRVAPFSDAELRKLHEIRKTFHARIHD